jgi:hypothetical protein
MKSELERRVEDIERQAGIKRETLLVVQGPDESDEKALRKAGVCSEAEESFYSKIIFINTNIPRPPC